MAASAQPSSRLPTCRGPPGRHPREEVAGGDRADPRLPRRRSAPSCCRRSSWRPRRWASCSRRRASAACSSRTDRGARAPSLRAIEETPAEEDEPSQWPPAGGGDDISFMLTTSGSTGLPKIVPLPAGAVDRFTDWAAAQFDIGPGTVVANYAPLNFDLCLLDIWTTLKHGGCVVLVDQDRATNGGYLADLITDQRGQRRPGGADALPAADRRQRARTAATSRSVKHAITTGDKIPADLARGPARPVPQRAASSTSTAARRRTTASSTSSRAWPTARCRRTSRSGSRCPACSTLIRTDDGEFLDGTGTGELLVWTPFQTRGYLNAALNAGQVRHASRGRQRRDDLLPTRVTSSAATTTARSRSRAAPTSTSRCAASASAPRWSSRRSRSTPT